MSKQQTSALRDLDTPHFRYWKALYSSFFSNALYVDVGKRWKRLSIGYLLLALFVIFLPFSLRVMFIMNQYLDREIINPIRGLPQLYLQGGKISLDKPMPYLVKDSNGVVKAIVDTTGTVTTMTSEYPALTFLITKDRLLYRIPTNPPIFSTEASPVNTGTVEQFVFTEDMNEIFNGAEWMSSSGVKTLKMVVLLTLYPSLVFGFFALFLFLFLAMAMMVQFVSYLFLKFTITFTQAFRLLMVSATPALTLLMILLMGNWMYPGVGLVVLVLLALYCSFAVLSLKRESNTLVRS